MCKKEGKVHCRSIISTSQNHLFAIRTGLVCCYQSKRKVVIISFFFWFLGHTLPLVAQTSSGIYVNEVMASNTHTLTDEIGDYEDWLEIYNANATPVDLSGYYLTDTPTQLTKFRFTSTPGQVVVPANGYLLIWASGNITKGAKHTNFALSAGGETVILVMPDGTTIVNSLAFGEQRADVSYGRLPNGGDTLKYFTTSTPVLANEPTNSYNELLTPPVFSKTPRFYSGSFPLTISHPDTAVTIYYTLDSSIPSDSSVTPVSYQYKNTYPGPFLTAQFRSFVYNDTLTMADSSGSLNTISGIATTHGDDLDYIPTTAVPKSQVIRAIATKPGALSSEIATNSYFFSPDGGSSFSLPIISITTQADGLFDYNRGIYVPGEDFENWKNANPGEVPNIGSTANYHRVGEEAERSAHFSIIENEAVTYQQDVGIRIHGGWSRGFRVKSLRVYGTDQYKTINYKLFPTLPYTEYKTFLLRNAGNDYASTLFRDAFIHESVAHLKIDIQAYRPAVLFLNGEYWGIHNLRQRQDKHYYNQKYNVDADNLDVLSEEVEEGDTTHYNAMLNYVVTNGVTDTTHYEYLKTQMDVESFSDYQITEIFYNNLDWGTNNIQYWRLKAPFSPTAPPGKDGRWRWSLYDTDACMSDSTWAGDKLSEASYISNWWEPGYLLGKLLQNSSFQNDFINRFADLLNTTFLPSRLTPLLQAKKEGIRQEIIRHIDRWKTPSDTSTWTSQINNCITFIEQRPAFQRQHIRNKFGISGEYNLTVNVSDPAHGYVRVNTIAILSTTPGIKEEPYPWTGSYFNHVTIQLRAAPKVGYKFKHWVRDSIIIADSVISVNHSQSATYLAIFETKILSDNPLPAPANVGICGYVFKEWSPNAAAGNTPANMKFVYMANEDPGLTSPIAGFTNGAYNLTSQTRINGKGSLGVSFINTGNGNVGYPDRKLGGAILALNTENKSKVLVSWKGRTLTPNARQYAIRLQYRIGDIMPFQDLLNEHGTPIEYVRSNVAGDSAVFLSVALPDTLLNLPYLQLLWRYYWKSGTSGARDELGIDDIEVISQQTLTGVSPTGQSIQSNGMIISTVNINSTADVLYRALKSIELKPGFEVQQGAVFKAQIVNCDQ